MEPSTTHKKSHWSIGDFYNKSWDLTWKNKKLWILGLAVSMYAAGGGSGGNSFDSSDLQELQQNQQQEQQLPESPYSDFEMVEDAGAQEESRIIQPEDALAYVNNPAMDGLRQVPIHVWGIIGIEFLLVVVGLIAFAFFLGSWSQAALIQGIAQAAANKKVELYPISSYAVTKVTGLIWISLVPFLKFIIKVLLIGAVGGIVLAILAGVAEGLSWVFILIALAALGWFLYELIRLSVAINYAFYICVEEDTTGPESFAEGYTLAKGNIWKTIRLGLVNSIVSGIIVFAVFLPVLGVGFGTLFADVMNKTITPMSFIPVGVMFMLTMPVISLVNGILKVFTFSTWHYAYEALTKK